MFSRFARSPQSAREVGLPASTPVSFATVSEGANLRGETAIGYLETTPDGRPAGVKLNPDLASARTYAPTDRVAVLATR